LSLALQTEINVVWQKFISELAIKPPPVSFSPLNSAKLNNYQILCQKKRSEKLSYLFDNLDLAYCYSPL
jgi:hypothetical protein